MLPIINALLSILMIPLPTPHPPVIGPLHPGRPITGLNCTHYHKGDPLTGHYLLVRDNTTHELKLIDGNHVTPDMFRPPNPHGRYTILKTCTLKIRYTVPPNERVRRFPR